MLASVSMNGPHTWALVLSCLVLFLLCVVAFVTPGKRMVLRRVAGVKLPVYPIAFLAVVAVAGVGTAGWAVIDQREDQQYQRFCIDHLTDQGRCAHGPAVEPRRKCLQGEWPPGVQPLGPASDCVKAWLAKEK